MPNEETPQKTGYDKGNSHKEREQGDKSAVPAVPDKSKMVISGEVVVQKKPFGRRFKDLIIEADMGSVGRNLVLEVVIPRIKDLIYDSGANALHGMLYGMTGRRRSSGSGRSDNIVSYDTLSKRGSSNVTSRMVQSDPRGNSRMSPNDMDIRVLLTDRDSAVTLLEIMNEAIQQYGQVSMLDLNERLGRPSSPIDVRWGWTYLGDVRIQNSREGSVIDFPRPVPITPG